MMFGECPWCGGPIGYGASFWGVGLVLLFGLLLLVGIVLLVIWAARNASGGGGSAPAAASHAEDPALATARRRFAAGEITKEQFDEIQHTLTGS